jgi:hypothetical protein
MLLPAPEAENPNASPSKGEGIGHPGEIFFLAVAKLADTNV